MLKMVTGWIVRDFEMAITVSRIPNEPIIVATLDGDINAEQFKEMFIRSAEITKEIGGHVCRITDARNVGVSFGELFGIIAAASKGVPGSTTDPNVTAILLGNNQMVKLAAQAFRQKQFGGLQIPLFQRMEDALEYVYLELAGQTLRRTGS